MAIIASFNPVTGILSLFGDTLDNTFEISRNAAGEILINGGAVVVQGGTPTVANTAQIQAFGQGGNDVLTLNEANGALPAAHLFGGTGHEALSGGSSADLLFGQAGNDVLLGKGGADQLFGGAGNDTLTGGDADDQVFGEAGNDRMIWNPGDDSDLFEGGAGIDTAEVNGGNGAEQFTMTANGTRVRFDRLDPAPFALDIGTTEEVVVNMNGGDDRFSATGNLAALVKLTVDGGAGNDTILGSNGNDMLIGGEGNDFIDGQQGNDVAFLGAGDDVFQWDPGDGNDVIEGQQGTDTMLFNGSAANEIMSLVANGGRALFDRNIASIRMDLNDVEVVDVQALGGTDSVAVGDMTRTDVHTVRINLSGTIGGTAGDGAADTVSADGTNGSDAIDILGSGSGVVIAGMHSSIEVSAVEVGDTIRVNGLGGNDMISATTLGTPVRLMLDGGGGRDTLLGGGSDDLLIGGDGNDLVDGNRGNDVADLGAGNDTFVWDPGDGNDVIEGGAGTDALLFNGANINEVVTIAANGGRALFLRDIANVTMDMNDVETIAFNALGGADNVIVGDMTGTDVTRVAIDLGAASGGGDGAADAVTANATQGADAVVINDIAGGTGVRVSGMAATVEISDVEGALDTLTVNGLGGNDMIDAAGLDAGVVTLVVNGGLGDDTIRGSAGDDLVNGGDGADIARLGAGDDRFVWNPGDDNDTIDGGAGVDTMDFNGANVAEVIDISADADHARFTRNIANVVMDLDKVEVIDFDALGGADLITVNDLGATDVTKVKLNLAGIGGGGDGAADTVVINATNGDDIIQIVNDNGVVRVLGLSAEIEISGFEAADRLVINGLDGHDVIEASGFDAAIQFVADGGAGDDVLLGGFGADVLLGGEGDDVLLGGGGLDVLDGGPGDNIVIQGLVSLDSFAFV